MSMELGSKDGILIRIMTLEDYKPVKLSMGGSFYNGEPLISCSERDVPNGFREKFAEIHNSLIKQGTCLLAVNENDGGRIVGLVLAGCEVPSDLELHRKDAEETPQNTWGRIATFFSIIERKVNVFDRYGVSKILCSHITNVHESMRGKGIGARLAAALMEVGRSKGIPLMVAYCSSFYSARQKEALGMECIYELAYADYKDAQGKEVFTPAAPHTHLRLMVIKL